MKFQLFLRNFPLSSYFESIWFIPTYFHSIESHFYLTYTFSWRKIVKYLFFVRSWCFPTISFIFVLKISISLSSSKNALTI